MAKTPSLRWSNEGILPGFQTVGISRRLGVHGHVPDVLGDPLGFLSLGGSIRHRRLVGQLAGVHDQKAYLGHVEASVRVFYGYTTDDTLPMPASRGLLPGPTRFFEQ